MNDAPPIDAAAVLAAAPCPFLLLAPDLTVLEVYPAYLKMVERTREE